MKTMQKKTLAENEDTARAYLPSIPKSYTKLYVKSLSGIAGRKGAIKAKCQNCVGYEATTVRIRECASFTCPLWRYRPYQQTQAEKRESKLNLRLASEKPQLKGELNI